MACSDVILRMGSIVSSFCSCGDEWLIDLDYHTGSGVRFFTPLHFSLPSATTTWVYLLLRLTKWNALLSGLTLCFSIYFIRLQFVYLWYRWKTFSKFGWIENKLKAWKTTHRQTEKGSHTHTHVFLLKSFIKVECSGIFLMSSQSLSVSIRRYQDYLMSGQLERQIALAQRPELKSNQNLSLNIH